MEPQRFDALSRSLAQGLSRRQIMARLGMGSLGAGLATAAGRERVVAQAPRCQLELVATVRLGSSAGAMIGGSVPGELRGELAFGIGEAGAIEEAQLRLEDGTELVVVGQVLGRAVHLRVDLGEDQHLVLVGTAEQDLGSCAGSVGGLLSGPQPGDLGDWQATATALGGDTGTSGSGSSSGRTTSTRVTETETETEEETETETEQTCPEGQELCEETCVDLSSDDANCGACGNDCTLTLDTCVDGECVDPCGTVGLTNCNELCVDLPTDPRHCGACGNQCAEGEDCVEGVCEGVCVEGLTACEAYCFDLQTNEVHCGACGNQCAEGEDCVNGTCVAPPVGPAPNVCVGLNEVCTEDVPCCPGAECVFVANSGICVAR